MEQGNWTDQRPSYYLYRNPGDLIVAPYRNTKGWLNPKELYIHQQLGIIHRRVSHVGVQSQDYVL